MKNIFAPPGWQPSLAHAGMPTAHTMKYRPAMTSATYFIHSGSLYGLWISGRHRRRK